MSARMLSKVSTSLWVAVFYWFSMRSKLSLSFSFFSMARMDFCFLSSEASNSFLSLIKSSLSFSICIYLGSIAFFIYAPR